MKLSLVATQGKGAGKVIPIPLAQFLIGRDPQCHLRPASPLISKRHCALLIRGEKAFVQDFGSTNGTHINDQPVKGEAELHNEDRLRIGPLAFVVRVESAGPAPAETKPVPRPESKSSPRTPARVPAGGNDEESIADMLLDMGDGGPPAAAGDETDVMSTIMEMPAVQNRSHEGNKPGHKPDDKQAPAVQKESSSFMARKILQKYQRRGQS
jgi:pSer/pThr/pTyr-binding forkhead associated (FHA) protein